jgi:hypothetical protein
MASRFYDVELADDGSLSATASAAAPAPMPADAEALLGRLKNVFNRIRLDIAQGARRTAYAQRMLRVAEIGLETGDLAFANTDLDSFDQADLDTAYYEVHIEDDDLHASAPPWAPKPMPEEATAFLSRIDKSIAKVKALVEAGAKRDRYLKTLLSFARRGLQDGDIKSATAALDDFEALFVGEEGPGVRKAYIEATLRTAAYVIIGAVIVGLVLTLAIQNLPFVGNVPMIRKIIPTSVSVVVGVCVGISFFVFVHNLKLSFDLLGNFDPANLDPKLRFTLVGTVALILCVFLMVGLVKLEIAGMKFEEFWRDRMAAAILGMVCGYSDAYITKLLVGVLDRESKP